MPDTKNPEPEETEEVEESETVKTARTNDLSDRENIVTLVQTREDDEIVSL